MTKTAFIVLTLGLIGATAANFFVASNRESDLDHFRAESAETLGLRSVVRADSHEVNGLGDVPRFPINVRKPSGPPRIELAVVDPQGRSASVACATCHQVRQPNYENVSAATLDEFHQGMAFAHGSITCYGCHNPNGSDTLRLADGSSLAYENVMNLCSQCHGPQATSFAHGAHGGMNGHWDLTRGPQMKNNCIDCHDPHSPAYPKMIVGFKPKDRFNEPSDRDHGQEGAESHDNH